MSRCTSHKGVFQAKRRYGLLNFLLFTAWLHLASPQVDEACRHPLGMEDKRIPDSSITVTSFYAAGTGPQYARLQRDEGDGAWCPRNPIQANKEDEHIQVKLPSSYFVTRIATQGRYAHGMGQEHVRSYKVKYSRDGNNWFNWTDPRGVDTLQGNSDANTVKQQVLSPGVAGARYVRIVPTTNQDRPVCMRLELYGCLWTSGLISYGMTAPDDVFPFPPRNPSTMYSDDTYDGIKRSPYFSRGLGQLTDGIVGDDDLSKTKSHFQTNAMGYDYVGWSQNTQQDRNVDITFRFDDLKNFTSMRVHCGINENIGARIFLSLVIQHSVDGRIYSKNDDASRLAFNTQVDVKSMNSRWMTIPLRNVVARFIKASFTIDGKRLLISEIEFYNENAANNVADNYSYDDDYYNVIKDSGNKETQVPEGPTENVTNNGSIPIIIGALAGVIALLVVIVAALYYRQRKLRKTLTPPSYSYRSDSNRSEQMVTLAPLMGPSGSNGLRTVPMETKPPIPIYQEIGPTPTVFPPDNLYLEPRDVIATTPPPPYQKAAPGQPESGATFHSQTSNQGNGSAGTSHYAETDLLLPNVELQAIQGVSGNNIYAVPWQSPSPRKHRRKQNKANTMPALHGTSSSAASTLLADLGEELHIDSSDLPPEFSRDRLKFVEKLGEGQFGEVQLCEAHPSLRDLVEEDEFQLPGSEDAPVLVAVKALREGASRNAKEDFLKEVRIMSRLQDPNIVRLLAICTVDDRYAMITEYMENGDLNQYLRGFHNDITPAPGIKTISNDVLMSMARQIASGMTYLSSLHFVHRDLATRNCLVGSDNSIRISDFGMSRNMYQSDYYRIQGRAILPIRWMSWECVLMGKFSHASDVWAFGVTLWEIFSLCKHQPHAALTDQEVIENMHHIFRRTGEEVYLPRPKRCPASLFNMIRQCWKRTCEERPTFDQLLHYLLERHSKLNPGPKRPQVKPPTPKPRTLSRET
ncbi:unnamed protein product [Clavelina lepadiformis]|uniref:Discoidin domain-containing receptor 2-like n=1 Tax=Clavelina lepadiformis TaxID=159417 RepID=A0ABP0F5M7_CLALP